LADLSVAHAIARGVNYFDVAPSYGDSEVQLGPALEPYRKDVFLACKTQKRDRAGAEEEFARSLERMRTDYFDLYQLHAITDVEKDVDAAFAAGGVMEMIEKRRNAGQIRHVGFSAHSIDAAFAAMDRYNFDSALVPINFAAHMKGGFGPQLIARAQEKGVALLALKAMACARWDREDPRRRFLKTWYEPLTDPDEASMGLRWTLSQPVVAAIPPGEEAWLRLALDIAAGPLDISTDETALLARKAEGIAPIFTA
jgi:predicted aldo/keto reductase-like oxidoreductase